MPDELEAAREDAENWNLVRTPLGEAYTLEVYRLCSRLDHQDPLSIIRDRGVGKAWLERMAGG